MKPLQSYHFLPLHLSQNDKKKYKTNFLDHPMFVFVQLNQTNILRQDFSLFSA